MLATQDVYPSSTAHLTNDERRQRLREKAFIIDMQLLSFARESAEFAVTQAWEEEGSETAIDWLRFNCHMTSNAAADLIAVGKNLGRMPETVQAVCQGEIGVAHVKAMARTANAVGTKFEEAPLLEKARENSPGKFYYICNHYRHAADRQGYEAEQARLVENRRLWITTCDDGTVLLSGSFDPEGGATFRTAIEPLARKSGAHDNRSREKRLGDAVVDLSMHALDSALIPRIVLGSDSMVIDVGRAKRTISGPARKALNVRDRSCTWPGCERPASWTSGHHLKHWIHGGDNRPPNLTLLCYRHHWMVHEGNLQIVRGDDGRMLTIPPTTMFGPRPRGPD